MIVVIDGNEPVLIERKINELVKDKENVIRINGNDSDFNINSLMEELDTESLFSTEKIILLSEPYFLLKKEKSDEEEDTKLFEEYIDNPSYMTDLIIYTLNNNFLKTTKIYKHVIKNAEQITLNSLDPYNFKNSAKSLCKDYNLNMTNEAFERLIEYVDNSSTSLFSSLEILKNYPDKIDEKCIDALCTKEINTDIFKLINALNQKDVSQAISILRNLYKLNTSVFMIIAVLANQLRFLYSVDYYLSKKYSYDEIADMLKCKKYRVQMSAKNLANLNRHKILDLLSKLSDIDSLNKSDSSLSSEERFELYIIKNFKDGL